MMGRALDDIVNDALDRDPADWPSFLEGVCSGDEDLKREVESLLAIHMSHPHLMARTRAPSEPVTGRIGSYRIVSEIARGGMGVVYEAEDEKLKRRVAVKVLPEVLARDPEWLRQFGREARILATMHHPNVADVYTLEEADGRHFLTMELLPPRSLADALSAGGLSLEEATDTCVQLARALEAVHAKGIVHCDLKPTNVLLAPDGLVKVIDFGLARRSEPATLAGGPLDSRRVPSAGTPGYMAPEQIEGNVPDQRADTWAFGCVLYECLAGGPAFGGDTTAERMNATLKADPDWKALPAQTPDAIRALLMGCIAKSPGDRLPSIALARRTLEQQLALPSVTLAGEDGGVHPNNLPVRTDSFVGRAIEMRRVGSLLESGRLVTLTGVGGGGKTRLAVEVASSRMSHFPNGVWLVDLSTARDADQALRVLASVLSVREEPSRPLLETLVEHLAARSLLLMMDNCERIAGVCRVIAERINERCERVRILATSREPLRADGEAVVAVPPLRVPDAERIPDLTELGEFESARLFMERVKEADSRFEVRKDQIPHIVTICRRLEGISLAIELAAAGCRQMSVEEVASALQEGVDLQPGGKARSQRELVDSLIGWSYGMLSPKQSTLFRRLSILEGGFTLDAAESVCAGDDIEPWEVPGLVLELRDKSLVELDARARAVTDKVRFRMLDMIREFSRVRREEGGGEPALPVRHLDYFLGLAEEAAPRLQGAEGEKWLSSLDADYDNIRAALARSADPHSNPGLALRFVAALEFYWRTRSFWEEARSFTLAMVDRGAAKEPTAARGHALHAAAWWSLNAGDLQEADARYDEALEIGRRLGDEELIARSLHNKGGVHLSKGNHPEARALFDEYLAIQRKRNDLFRQSIALNNLALVAEREDDLDTAGLLYEESLELARQAGDKKMQGVLLSNLGSHAVLTRRFEEARRRFELSLELCRDLGDRWNEAGVLNLIGAAAEETGDYDAASSFFKQSLEIYREFGDPGETSKLLTQFGILSASTGRPERAARLLAAAMAFRERVGIPVPQRELRLVDEAVSKLRSDLGEPELTRLSEEGRAMSSEQAIGEALEG